MAGWATWEAVGRAAPLTPFNPPPNTHATTTTTTTTATLTLIANRTLTVPMTLLCWVYTALARSIME
jgi:hypothetical protein